MSANKNLIKIKKTIIAVFAVAGVLVAPLLIVVTASASPVAPSSNFAAEAGTLQRDAATCQGDCVQNKPDPATQTGDLDCDNGEPGGDPEPDPGCNFLTKYLNPFIKVLAGAVGIVIVISIIIGGIRYSTSAGDPQAVNAAKTQIRNAIIALLCFFFLYAFLQFMFGGVLVPEK